VQRWFLLTAAFGVLLVPSLLQAHGTFRERLALASARIEGDPANACHYVERSILYRDHGEFAASLADLDRGAQLDPAQRELGLSYGRLYLAWNQPETARTFLEGSLAKHGNQPATNATLARALVQLGRHLEAAGHYTLAIEHAPVANPGHYLERARALRAAGDTHREQALRGLDAGMERMGLIVALAMIAIEIEVDLGRFDSALARVDGLAAPSGRQETWLARRGEILEVAQRPDRARESYLRVLTEIGKLPAQRRRTPAMTQLRLRADTGLARLAGASE
jgi:tetratricopeptide (TPR) repeat protein